MLNRKMGKILPLVILLSTGMVFGGCQANGEGKAAGQSSDAVSTGKQQPLAEDMAEDPVKQLVEEVEGITGKVRVVNREEYEFYKYFAEREIYDKLSDQELEHRTEEYINRVKAIFLLGNELDICEPYDFSTLKMRCSQENDIRKIKKEKGEPIYGLEQFTLENYYQYQRDLVENEIKGYLESLQSDWLTKEAKDFYEKNKDSFKYREQVIYEVTENGSTKTLTAGAVEISLLSNADGALADFLIQGNPGEEYSDATNQGDRRVIIKEVTYSGEGFEKNQEAAVKAYIDQELYPYLINTLAEQNPVNINK